MGCDYSDSPIDYSIDGYVFEPTRSDDDTAAHACWPCCQ